MAYEGLDVTVQGSQELSAVTDWLRLGHEHIRELFDSKVKAEKALALAQEEWKEKEEMLLEKLVAKHEQENNALKTDTARPKNVPKADQLFLDAVLNMETVVEKARREMSNLVAGKNRPTQAFAKWEKDVCRPSLDILHVAEQLKNDGDRCEKMHADQMLELLRREEKVQHREECTERTREKQYKKLREEQETFAKEQGKCRLKRAEKLEGEDLRVVEETWFRTQEQNVRAQIWDEAKEANYALVKEELEQEHAAQRRREWRSGREAGYEDGRKQGQADILNRYQAQLNEARADGYHTCQQEAEDAEVRTREMHYNDGYTKGLEAGNEEGYKKGLEVGNEVGYKHGQEVGNEEGYAKGVEVGNEQAETAFETTKEELFYRGLHRGVRMSDWRGSNMLEPDGTANERHPYWWGRGLADYLQTHNL
jgi:hypothetical protein